MACHFLATAKASLAFHKSADETSLIFFAPPLALPLSFSFSLPAAAANCVPHFTFFFLYIFFLLYFFFVVMQLVHLIYARN